MRKLLYIYIHTYKHPNFSTNIDTVVGASSLERAMIIQLILGYFCSSTCRSILRRINCRLLFYTVLNEAISSDFFKLQLGKLIRVIN